MIKTIPFDLNLYAKISTDFYREMLKIQISKIFFVLWGVTWVLVIIIFASAPNFIKMSIKNSDP